jgi:hypothetical protein
MARPPSSFSHSDCTAYSLCDYVEKSSSIRASPPIGLNTGHNLSPWRRETVPWHDIQAFCSRPVFHLSSLVSPQLYVLSHSVSNPWPSGSHRIVRSVFVADRISHNFSHNRSFVVWFHSLINRIVCCSRRRLPCLGFPWSRPRLETLVSGQSSCPRTAHAATTETRLPHGKTQPKPVGPLFQFPVTMSVSPTLQLHCKSNFLSLSRLLIWKGKRLCNGDRGHNGK